MANNLGQGVNNKFILTDSGILRYDMRGSLTVVTATTASVSRYLSLRSFLSAVPATTATSVRFRRRRGLSLVPMSTTATTTV